MTNTIIANEKPISTQALSPWIRWPVVLFFLGVIVFVIIRYFIFIYNPQSAAPSALGLPTMFVFSSFVVLFFAIPLEKWGVRLTKIGPIEFEKIIQTQASETSEVVTEIESRIDLLESFALDSYGDVNALTLSWKEPEVRDEVLGFLKNNEGFFSPLRIKHLSRKQGCKTLQGVEVSIIKRALRGLLNEGVVDSTVSQRGNTIYRLKRNSST